MATIRFTDLIGVGTDMGQTDLFYGDAVRSTESMLRFSDGEFTITFNGDFATRRGDIVGDLDGMSERQNGVTIYTATDIGLDAAVVWAFAEADDTPGALRYLTSGDDAVFGTRFADVLLGGGGRDVLRGLGGKDRIDGGRGGDKLSGGDGGDRLEGGAGGDRLFGGAGDDRLEGGAGNDELIGGDGRNALTGGAGADDFVFAKLTDFGFGADRNVNVIRDFSRGDGDRIDVEALDANMLEAGFQAFHFIGRARFSDTAGELRFKAGMLSADVHGDGRADFFIELSDVDRLSASDFLL